MLCRKHLGGILRGPLTPDTLLLDGSCSHPAVGHCLSFQGHPQTPVVKGSLETELATFP